jgi:signal transduction histidine kinase
LNTPLATILGYAQMLLEDTSTRRELAAIEDQARRCKKIVQGLLDFARKSSGGREYCAPNALVTKVRDLLSHTLQMRGIRLELELAEPAPPGVFVARVEIEQVLVNLITNAGDALEIHEPAAVGASHENSNTNLRFSASAKRAAPEGACVTVQTRMLPNAEVMIAVEDNGLGVPEELSERVFEPFFTTKAAGRGTGLGLSIARRIIEDHNGTLSLTTRLDGRSGARFEIRLRCGREGAR